MVGGLFLGLALACVAKAPPPVRITDFEQGTLFGLEQVTFDEENNEKRAALCGGDRMVFDTNRDGNWEIYLKEVTGKEITRKTTSSSADYAPTITADCQYIAFVSNREGDDNIYIISGIQASAATKVGPGIRPNFTADGSAIYYGRYLSGERAWSIWVYDRSTRQHSQLVRGIHPAISPDGTKLAYSKFNNKSGFAELWIVDMESHQEQQIAAMEDAALIQPVWSPDGKKLLLTKNEGSVGRTVAETAVANYHKADIAVVNVDGTDFTMLTDNPANDLGRAWSEDNHIFFSSNRQMSYDIWRFEPRFVE